MNGRWHTREDVLGDLYRATGNAPDVDDLHFVYGERPPPHVQTSIDDEMMIMFGDQVHAKQVPDQMDKPDLKGIVSMLRMVEQSEDENRTPGPELKPSDIIYISKLNPNVCEFVPKNLSPRTPIPETKSEKKNNEKEDVKQEFLAANETTTKLTKLENIDIHADGDKNCDEKQPRCDEKQSESAVNQTKGDDKNSECDERQTKHNKQLANGYKNAPQHDVDIEKLHNKICEAAQHDTFHHKKEKNAAIATLLKLHSRKPIKLYTPEFFENSKATDFKGADEDSSPDVDEVKIDDKNSERNDEINDEKIDENDIKASEEIPQVNKLNDVNLEDNLKNDENITKEDINVIEEPKQPIQTDDEIQQSIEKVTNWFNGVTHKPTIVKAPEPVLNTSQFAYKRKEMISPASNISSFINKKMPRPVESYKPSSYAKELREKYAARNKELEKKQVANIWDKLDEELKKRDEEKRRAREENNI